MKLLVSVRSPEEAWAALDGGADVIDIKEPARGSLGRADDATIVAVLGVVAGRKSVSAACGELLQAAPVPKRSARLEFLKWGLAGCARRADWPALFNTAANRLPASCRPVAVAYADWERAEAPPPAEVCALARNRPPAACLLDTWHKDGKTLLDFLSMPEIARLVNRCRDAGVPVALAGSLGLRQIEMLLPFAPDWFAVRGAVCEQGNRRAAIDPERVRQLAGLLARSASKGSRTGASG
jgi:(5-formylfuran-3-yl)methyl phosphate synthase